MTSHVQRRGEEKRDKERGEERRRRGGDEVREKERRGERRRGGEERTGE